LYLLQYHALIWLTAQWLTKQLGQAWKEVAEQQELFVEFASKILQEKVTGWVAEVVEWEKDPNLPDSYYRELKGLSRLASAYS
jgi:hypothetical protein